MLKVSMLLFPCISFSTIAPRAHGLHMHLCHIQSKTIRCRQASDHSGLSKTLSFYLPKFQDAVDLVILGHVPSTILESNMLLRMQWYKPVYLKELLEINS